MIYNFLLIDKHIFFGRFLVHNSLRSSRKALWNVRYWIPNYIKWYSWYSIVKQRRQFKDVIRHNQTKIQKTWICLTQIIRQVSDSRKNISFETKKYIWDKRQHTTETIHFIMDIRKLPNPYTFISVMSTIVQLKSLYHNKYKIA